jgi:hypothetical protein
MAQRRDRLGRFAGSGGGGKARSSGSISTTTRATTTGARARLNARTMKAEQVGAKGTASYQARSARATMRGRASVMADGGNYRSGAKLLGNVATRNTQRSNQSRAKVKTMERERRSLLRRGSMRGGG